MIIPRIQSCSEAHGSLTFSETVTYFAADVKGSDSVALFAFFAPTVAFIPVHSREKADFVLECRYDKDIRPEGYTIQATSLPILVNYRDFGGARNAASTISQLLSPSENGYSFPVCEISDWPDFPMRSLMLDPARRLIPVTEVEETLIRMALAKYNYLHLHLSDGTGYAIQSDVVRFSGPEGGQYTKDEIRHIVAFAERLGITIIPEFEFPGHGFRFLKDHPEFACVTDGTEAPSPWAVCAGNEEYYKFLEAAYTEIASMFPGDIIHVGTDEIEMNDLTELRTWPTWHCCSRCRELCEREGIDRNSRTEIFYYMLRRVYKIITGLGKRLMMWNDNIDISKTPELPRDILIHFWRVAGINRGPVEGCSMERFLEEGFQVFNSYYPETYIEADFYRNNDDTILVWTPRTQPEHDSRYDGQILGGEACAWGSSLKDGTSHFSWTLPSSLMLFGDRLWNAAPCTDLSAFGLAATRYQLGIDVPADLNLFREFGGFMQPRRYDGTRMWRDRASADLSAVDAALEKLEKPWLLTGRLAAEYRKSIAWLNEERRKASQ